jgi:hypothetical protein
MHLFSTPLYWHVNLLRLLQADFVGSRREARMLYLGLVSEKACVHKSDRNRTSYQKKFLAHRLLREVRVLNTWMEQRLSFQTDPAAPLPPRPVMPIHLETVKHPSAFN